MEQDHSWQRMLQQRLREAVGRDVLLQATLLCDGSHATRTQTIACSSPSSCISSKGMSSKQMPHWSNTVLPLGLLPLGLLQLVLLPLVLLSAPQAPPRLLSLCGPIGASSALYPCTRAVEAPGCLVLGRQCGTRATV